MATKRQLDTLTEKLVAEKESSLHWRTRALVGEKTVQEAVKKYATLNKSYYDLLAELEETKKRLPTGATLTYIDNLIRLNDAYRRELIGDKIGFWQRLKFLFPLLLKG